MAVAQPSACAHELEESLLTTLAFFERKAQGLSLVAFSGFRANPERNTNAGASVH